MGSYAMWISLAVIFFNCVNWIVGVTEEKDELENHINPDDLRAFLDMGIRTRGGFDITNISDYGDDDDDEDSSLFDLTMKVDCFGLGVLSKLMSGILNLRPGGSGDVNTHFYFSSRMRPHRVRVFPGNQSAFKEIDFNSNRKTVLIVHGFMSYGNASWVTDMTKAFLAWRDVNVIAVDWSGGGNTWKYWRAVANTRTVGSDIADFFIDLMAATGAKAKDFHFVGHSLGAHICSFASYHLGGISRITGLDPAQPCFRTSNLSERLDDSDADFVDVIHTNGRRLGKIGFGLPDPIGHIDFYPNGGMKQPGCKNYTGFWDKFPFSPGKLKQAVCNHGRAYLLFTETLININCTFRAHQWNLTYEGANSSLTAACDCDFSSTCQEMGIKSMENIALNASGTYILVTSSKQPYCPTTWERCHPREELLIDLRKGFVLNQFNGSSSLFYGETRSLLYAVLLVLMFFGKYYTLIDVSHYNDIYLY